MNNTNLTCFQANHAFKNAFPDWKRCADSLLGERQIKECGELYLPMTEGQLADRTFGRKRYEAYKNRACYFPYYSNTVFSMLGLLHRESPEAVELPERIEKMKMIFASDGSSLEETLHRVNFFQLAYGRCGLLLDVPPGDSSPFAVPVVSLFSPRRILDWDVSSTGRLRYLLLDESHDVFDPVLKNRFYAPGFRICALDRNGEYYSRLLSPRAFADYDLSEAPSEESYPIINGRRLEKVPFTFVNTADTGADIHPPPLLPLADIALAIYRGEADYRHALFMQGQSTLFLKGFPLDTPPMMGAGNYIHTDSPDAEGRFLEISGAGLGEMRAALSDLHSRAADLGLNLSVSAKESGEALKTRLSVKTALLRTIASTADLAFCALFRIAAEWCGADPDEVVFKTNKDFSDNAASASEALQLLNAKNAGMPLSDRSIHDWLRKNDFTDASYEKDLAEIKDEKKD